jgi:hypothetical protein
MAIFVISGKVAISIGFECLFLVVFVYSKSAISVSSGSPLVAVVRIKDKYFAVLRRFHARSYDLRAWHWGCFLRCNGESKRELNDETA